MTKQPSRFDFSSAPDSWGVLDHPGPSWKQRYQRMLEAYRQDVKFGATILPPGESIAASPDYLEQVVDGLGVRNP